jgi:AhpD family alkylhydroperoxidase
MKYVSPVGRHEAKGIVALVYKQIEKEYQLVPPLMLHSQVPELLAAIWGITRESFLAGKAGRIERETVAAAVSTINACPFCVEAHAMSLHGAGRHELASSLVSNDQVKDPVIQPFVTWASATRAPGSFDLLHPPFSSIDMPYFIGTALAFHYINRVVHVFLGDSALPALPGISVMRSTVRKAVGKMLMSRFMTQALTPGLAEGLLRSTLTQRVEPPDFAWAAGNEPVLQAWRNFYLVTHRLGERHIPLPVCELLDSTLRRWKGEDMGLSRTWVYDLTRDLAEEQHPIARLVLLTALASHQIDDQVIRDFLLIKGNDRLLVPTVAWASAMATFQIESWLTPSEALHMP